MDCGMNPNLQHLDTIMEVADLSNEEGFKKACEVLKDGGLVAFPTETVYGLGADALRAEASAKIYQAKGRPSDNPLIVHIADAKSVYEIAEKVPETAKILMEAFWPGPLTIILPKKEIVPDGTTGGLKTVAIRMPSHPAALKLIKDSGIMIAAPSANLSGRPSPTTAKHVADDMTGRIDMILDGGPVGIGIESTIVDLTGDVPTILRPGFITVQMLRDMIGEVRMDPALESVKGDIKPKAPGMKYTHYAPKGELSIIEGDCEQKVIDEINRLVEDKVSKGYKVAVLSDHHHLSLYRCDHVLDAGSMEDGITVSAALYGLLRECDDLSIDFIFSEAFDEGDMGYAIMNRLIKAAGHRIIHV